MYGQNDENSQIFDYFREVGAGMDKTTTLKVYESGFFQIVFLVKNHYIVAYINIFRIKINLVDQNCLKSAPKIMACISAL